MSAIVADASCIAAALIAADSSGPWASGVLREAALVHVPHLMHIEAISRLRKAELQQLCSTSSVEAAIQKI